MKKLMVAVAALLAGSAAFGGVDGALKFSGATGKGSTVAAVSTDAKITTTAFVVEAWVKPTGDAHPKEIHFFDQDLSGNSGRLMLCLDYGKPRFQIGSASFNAATTLPLGEWTHLAFRRTSAGEMRIYVNGEMDDGAKTNANKIADTTIALGKLVRTGTVFAGELSEVRVWKADRNNATIKANFTRRMKGNESNLLYCWPLDDGNGTTCRELVSGKGGTIVLTSDVSWTDSMLPFVLSKQTLTGARNDRLFIGDGTLVAPANSEYTLNAGYDFNARNPGAAVIRVEDGATLTVKGSVACPDSSSGGFIKAGKGTLVYSGAGNVTLAAHTLNNEAELVLDDVRGIGPTAGYHCGDVVDGTLVVDKPDGSTFQVAMNGTGRLMTGTMHKENGVRTVGHVIVSNGTVNCGIVGLSYIGEWRAAATATDPFSTFTMEGGTVDATGALRLGQGNCVFNMNGGTFINPTNQHPYFVGNCAAGVTRVINLNGGTFVACDLGCNGGSDSTSRAIVNFNGAVWKANNIPFQTVADDGASAFYVKKGGAKFDCSESPNMLGISMTLQHDPELGDEKDGGLTVVAGSLKSQIPYSSTYTGDTVVEPGATLVVSPNGGGLVGIPTTTVVKNGARLYPCDWNGNSLKTAGLRVEDGGILMMSVNAADGKSCYFEVRKDAPTFGVGYVELIDTIYDGGTYGHYFANGTYKVATYTGADPDVSQMQVYELPEGKKATFAAANGTVTVTIATDSGEAAQWNVDRDGNFSDAANWDKTPAAGGDVAFGPVITADRTVTTAGETVGVIGFNSEAASYTLDGTGLTVNQRLSVDAGEHAITAPLTLGGAVDAIVSTGAKLTVGELTGEGSVNATGGGTLAVTEVPAKPVTLDNATLDVPDGANWNLSNVTIPEGKTGGIGCAGGSASVSGIQGSGALRTSGKVAVADVSGFAGVEVLDGALSLTALPASLTLGKAVLNYIGTSASSASEITIQPYSGNAAVINNASDIDLTGRLNVGSGAFVKRGAGNLILQNSLAKAAAIGYSQNLGPASGEPAFFDLSAAAESRSPAYGFTSCSVEEGTLTLKSGAFTVNNSTLAVGSSTVPNGQPEKSATVVVDGAKLTDISQLHVGWYNYTTDPSAEPPESKFIVSNGTVTAAQLYIGHAKTNVVGRTKPTFVLEGGTVNVNTSLAFGAWQYAPSDDSVASLIVNGGTLNLKNFNFGDRTPSGGGDQMKTYFELNGGKVVCADAVCYAKHLSAATLRLNGGTLEATRMITSGDKRDKMTAYIYFNGTTFVPTMDNVTSYAKGQTAGGFYVQKGGLKVDLSKLGAGKYHEFTSVVYRDPALAADEKDGGLTLTGPSDRAFYASSDYLQFNGPFRLEGGFCNILTLQTNDLYVAKGATITMRDLPDKGTTGDFSGEGFVTNSTRACGLNIYGKFHSQGATIDNLRLKPGSSIVCDGKSIAKAVVSATIDRSVTYDFAGSLPEDGTVFPILDVSGVDAAKLSVPRKLKVTLDGEAVDSHLRVALTVEDGVLMGKLTRNGALLIVR